MDLEDKMKTWYAIISRGQSNPYTFENYVDVLSNNELIIFMSDALKHHDSCNGNG